MTAMERRGIRTEVGNMNREIRAVNAELIENEKKLKELEELKQQLEKKLPELNQEKALLQHYGFQAVAEIMPAVDEVKANRKKLIGERRKVMEGKSGTMAKQKLECQSELLATVARSWWNYNLDFSPGWKKVVMARGTFCHVDQR